MRIIIQRVKEASVEIDQKIVGQIEHGYMILVGIHDADTKAIVEHMAKKVSLLRIFDDENGKMNRSILDKQGSILSISQFTLFADTRKGNRPGFTEAGKPEHSKELYLYFNETLRNLGIVVEEGEFGADMQVCLQNDGPITIYMDSQEMSWGK
ncbi:MULTISPECIES: D-aminoacyl-tRNA deacylase [Terrabacteria group]|uniref:D-aminoacyl-tRNA deacylase n=1 Tax=Bacillati TaxID=1783272 RepID=UPI001C6F384C|nr:MULTISPECIES: D-aminoacyl-tRNA deacylase [Terrabacteria group]MBW9212916.1 D-tyrosyl-tRNA(Tyr) deacylase [Trueperella sp. zg.1013]